MGVAPCVVVVVAGGDPLAPEDARLVPSGALVIAADSGLDRAYAVGIAPHLAVGDFDSVDAPALARAERSGTVVERHPAAKDATDLELALDAAVTRGAERILVLGGHGGRLDHHLANLLLLAAPRYAEIEVSARVGDALVHVVRSEVVLHGEPGDLVSLLPVHGPVEGVRTTGLRYALAGERLEPGSSRGVSNVFEDEAPRITVRDGTLLVIQPGARR